MYGYKTNEYFIAEEFKENEQNRLKAMLQEGKIDFD